MYQFENIKITEGNAFSLLITLKRRTYVSQRPIDEDIDILNLQNVVVKFGGVQYPCTLQEDGVLVDFPADLKCGTYDLVLTADYMDNAIRAAYFEAVTIVSYNYQSDAHNFVQGSPIVMKPAFVIYNLSDAELEQLKQQYREAIAAAEQAEADAEQAKEEWEQKAADLDNVAQQDTLLQKSAAIIEAISGIHIDIPDNIATKDDVTAAKQAILDALSHISPEDPYSKALAEFFGVTLLQGYEFMTDTEVTDELEDIMQALDPELEQEVEYPEGSGTYMTKAQAITAEAMQIINPSQS